MAVLGIIPPGSRRSWHICTAILSLFWLHSHWIQSPQTLCRLFPTKTWSLFFQGKCRFGFKIHSLTIYWYNRCNANSRVCVCVCVFWGAWGRKPQSTGHSLCSWITGSPLTMEQPTAHLGIPQNIFGVEFTPQTVWSGDNWPDVEHWDRIPQ